MEGDPFGLIEAMTIAGYATGCERGYLYIRGEYPLATRRLQRAIDAARARGLPRRRRAGRGLRVRHRAAPRRGRLHLRRGDRAAQLDRGLPRRAAQQAAVPQRPGPVRQADRDQQRGDALQRPGGPRASAARRSRRSAAGAPPARSCSASRARCGTPGVYEVDFGTTLRELLDAGRRGARATCARSCSAGRPAGSSSPDQLDVPLTLEGTREIGATLGSGVVLAFDTSRRPHRRRCGGSPRSSATSRAGSACPAGSAPCDRRRRWPGWPAARRWARGTPSSPCSTTSPGSCRTRRSAGSGRPRPRPSARRSPSGCSTPRRVRTGGCDDRDGTGAARRHPQAGHADRRRRRGPRPRGRHDPRRAARRGRRRQADTPTLCWAPNLTPINACRVCVVEVEGSPAARAVVRAQGRGRHGGPHRHREGPPQPAHGAGAARVVGRPVPGERGRAALDVATTASTPRATARPRRRPPTATPATPATTTPPTGPPRRPSRSP